MVRVRPISDEDLDDLIDRAEKLFAAAARKSFNAAASRVRHPSLRAAGDDQFVSYDDAGAAHTVWTEQLVTLTPIVEEAFEATAFGVIGGIGDAVLPDAAQTGLIFPAILDQASVTHLTQAKNRMAHFGQAAWNDVRRELETGFRAGESIDEMTKRITTAGNITAERARTVARTEVISASNAGAMAAAKTMPPVLQPEYKEWLSTSDSRTRPDHAAADGQQRKLNEKFSVGGASLAYPGDPLGPAGEIINCRCTVLFDVEPVSCTCAEPALAASSLLAAASSLNQANTVYAQARIALGIGRKQMAQQLGWPIHKLYQIEFGKKAPSSTDLAQMLAIPGYQTHYTRLANQPATPPPVVTPPPGANAIGNCACSKPAKPAAPKPKPAVTQPWAPIMSAADADRYTADSQIKGPQFYGTQFRGQQIAGNGFTDVPSNKQGALGDGFYFSGDPTTARAFMGADGDLVEVRLLARNPMSSEEFHALRRERFNRGVQGNAGIEGDIQARGYDSVRLNNNEITVFKREQVVVVNVTDASGISRINPPKPAATPPLRARGGKTFSTYRSAEGPVSFTDEQWMQTQRGVGRRDLSSGPKEGDRALAALYNHHGFDDLPDVVSKEELDALIAEGHTEVYRGVQKFTSRSFADEFRTGQYFPGYGIYGNGTYTAAGRGSLATARDYAGSQGEVMRMAFKKNARVISYEDAVDQAYKASTAAEQAAYDAGRDWQRAAEADALRAKSEVLRDPGRWAAAEGYDAIIVDKPAGSTAGKYIVVLNRTAVTVQRTNVSRMIR